jgi:hypothetical protein
MLSQKYLEILSNPSKALKNEQLVVEYINDLITESNKYYDQLNENQKKNIDDVFGPKPSNFVSKIKTFNDIINYGLSMPKEVISLNYNIENILFILHFRYNEIIKYIESVNCADTKKELDEIINKLQYNIKKPDFFLDAPVPEATINLVRTLNNKYSGILFSDRDLADNKKGVSEEFKQKKAFYDEMTNLIANELIFNDKYQTEIFNFQYMVNKIFNSAIEKYVRKEGHPINSIIFAYKGGTTMKILYDKYKNLFNNNNFIDDLASFFQRSDSDYQIFIDQSVFSDDAIYNKIYYDMNVLTFNTLLLIKDILRNPKITNCILPVNKVSQDDLKNKLVKLNSMIKETKKVPKHYFKDISNFIGISFNEISYFSENIPNNFELNESIATILREGSDKILDSQVDSQRELFKKNRVISPDRRDYFITPFKHTDNKFYPKLIYTDNNDNKDGLFTYFNETTIFSGWKPEDLGVFGLHRMKINSILYYKTNDGKYGFINLPGELIDISISAKNDYKSKAGVIDFSTHLKQYSFKINNNEMFFNSYSIKGFINDLNKALLVENEYPWNDAKYKKKINRITFFILMDLLNTKSNQINLIMVEMEKFINSNKTNVLSNYSQLVSLLDDEHKKLFEKIKEITEKPSLTTDDTKQFNELLQLLRDIITKFNASVGGLKQNIGNSNYNAIPEPVPYLEKYLKYKNKYYHLKKLKKNLNNK